MFDDARRWRWLGTRTGNDRVDAEYVTVVTAADLRDAGNLRCIGDERDRQRGAPVEVGRGSGSGPRRLARADRDCPIIGGVAVAVAEPQVFDGEELADRNRERTQLRIEV